MFVFNFLQAAHSTRLSVRDYQEIEPTIGPIIRKGEFATVCEVKGSNPLRVYKMINEDYLDPREVRIAQIAGRIGVGPVVHSTFETRDISERFVVIEMDHAGQSMGKCMEVCADEIKQSQLKSSSEFLSTEKAQGKVSLKRKERASLEETLDHIYSKRETFYFELFSKLKQLAEANISYSDLQVGNIMPNAGTKKGMLLIDFDGSTIEKNPQAAKVKSLKHRDILRQLESFQKLPDLSDKSKELIQWFS